MKTLGADFQAVVDKTKDKLKSLESMNISAYEQSYQIIDCRYELLEVFFKPLTQLATHIHEDLGTGVRQLISGLGRLHDTSQAYLAAATEMGGDGGAGGGLSKSRISPSGVCLNHRRDSSIL